MELQQKILQYFEGKVVRKDLNESVKGNAVVPTYVLEYLLGQYCASADEELLSDGIEKVKNVIRDNYVSKSDAEVVKFKIREDGSYKIIDSVKVALNDKANIYEAEFDNLGIKNVPISDKIVKDNEKLLSGNSVWSIITMGYTHAADAKIRWLIEDLKPIQISYIVLDEYIEARKNFSADEWLDLLMHSIGLNPEYFNRRGKLIQISRLIPHAENNFNYIELGPKGTGKSHVFQELSPHGTLISGGDVSKARLFVNNNGNKVGLISFWDVIALDEFEQGKGKKVDSDLVTILQNYMANKSFNRGGGQTTSTASLAFIGNTKHTVPFMLKNSHLFESIPDAYLKGAFLDRMHIYVPGWEVKILKKFMFSTSYGFIVDYLAEILRNMRKDDFSNILDEYVSLDGSLSARDKTAVQKTFSGLAKLMYPDRLMKFEEVIELLDFAMEGRKRVKDQLYIIDETFRNEPTEFKYTIKSSGIVVAPETLERRNFAAAVVIKEDDDKAHLNIALAIPTIQLKPQQISIKDNQTGISYQSLFADYVKGTSEIKLLDPYIRMPYQFKNLLEFCVMLAKTKQQEEEVALHVVTWNTPDRMGDSELSFQELIPAVAELGINLTYEYKSLHDRSITANNGWKINLGRGLDIFAPRDGKLDPAEYYQEMRLCKNCELIYVQELS